MPTYFQAIKSAKRLIRKRALDPYVAVYLMQRRLRWNNTRLLMNYSQIMSVDRINQYKRDLNKYLNGQSPQYIIGTASFYGYNFKVNHNVLIPRPETEGLVDWILHDYDKNHPIKLVDIGTGSGAIAIALKLQRPDWQVTATDISSSALSVAKENAEHHHVRISFIHCDLFKTLPKNYFDVIVSNPPYVSKTEISEMGKDVLRNEPHIALFAAHNGMAVYQRIANSFNHHLKASGSLYLEIGFNEKKRIVQLFTSKFPEDSIEVKNDLSNHPRMVKIRPKV